MAAESASRQDNSVSQILQKTRLTGPLLTRLQNGRDHAALEFLARECSLPVLSRVTAKIADYEVAAFLVDQVVLAASLLSCEAFTGIESIRKDLRVLGENAARREAKAVSLKGAYDQRVERLGQHFFALGRRLIQLEQLMENCPLSGSGETLRGRYGQRVRDLAGDVRFMRQELSRWVRRFVPLKRSKAEKEPPAEAPDLELIAGRIDAVVDELGLRVREVGETLSTALFEQLLMFEPELTRKELFRRDLENVLDLGHLLDGLTNLHERVKAFDEERRPEQLARVKALLSEFSPGEFLSFSAVRESEQKLFLAAIEDLRGYEPPRPGARNGASGHSRADDPIQVFLLVTGDLIAHLRRQHRK